jgi:hypothetical protein
MAARIVTAVHQGSPVLFEEARIEPCTGLLVS